MSERLGGLVLFIALFGLSAIGIAQAPGGECTVTRLRLRIATSNDDLRGGQDNLNIVVFFANAKPHVALNVNKSANWPNNSVNMVDIFLSPPVPPSEIQALRFIHISDGGINTGDLLTALTPAAPIKVPQAFQSPDNWNMADVAVAAIGNGVGARIASYGYHRFTGSDPVLTIPARIPADICGSGRPTSSSGSGSNNAGGSGLGTNPSTGPSNLQSISGGSGQGNLGGTSGALTNQDVVRMAKAGVPESAIIASIQGRPAKFDVSPEALIALKRSGASQSILQAMVLRGNGEVNLPAGQLNGDGKAADELNPQPYPPKSKMNATRGDNADELNPQPYPPKATLLTPGGQRTMLATPTTSPSGNGGKSALTPLVQRPASTEGTKQGATATPETAQLAGGDPAPRKAPGRSEYDAITVDRGVTNDPAFNQWANKANQSNTKMVAPPQATTPAGSNKAGSGTLTLNGGTNQGSSTPPLQATTPAGLNKIGSGTLSLNGGTNQGGSSAVPPPQATTPAGLNKTGGGTLLLNGGTNQGSSSAVPPPQATTPAGLNKIGSGTLSLNGGTNQGSSSAVPPPQATTPAGLNKIGSGTLSLNGGNNQGSSRTASVAETRIPVALNSTVVRAACAQDPTPRILGVTGSAEPVTLRPRRRYVIWGCSFGPANPNNAVYLSDGNTFTWFLSKSSWSSNAVDVSFSVAASGVQGFQKTYGGTQLNNLMLFVLGQNGNAKLNGVTLSVQ